MSLFVLTGSHISSMERFEDGLMLTVQNVASFYPKINHHYISLSIDDKLDSKIIERLKSYPHLTILHQSDKTLQFDHLEKIIKHREFKPDDLIMMLDDDDIILELPEGKLIKGVQYIPDNSSDQEATAFQKMVDKTFEGEWISKSIVATDFSGYTAPYSIVKKYFDNRPFYDKSIYGIAMASMEDIDYMKFLDKEGAIDHKPFIFHKLWAVGNSTWKNDVDNAFEKIIQDYKKTNELISTLSKKIADKKKEIADKSKEIVLKFSQSS